jgi:hypothetical protein
MKAATEDDRGPATILGERILMIKLADRLHNMRTSPLDHVADPERADPEPVVLTRVERRRRARVIG